MYLYISTIDMKLFKRPYRYNRFIYLVCMGKKTLEYQFFPIQENRDMNFDANFSVFW